MGDRESVKWYGIILSMAEILCGSLDIQRVKVPIGQKASLIRVVFDIGSYRVSQVGQFGGKGTKYRESEETDVI